jgi:hypothetical protein
MSTQFQQAIEAIKAGDKKTGGRLLGEVLRADPQNEMAWLWMSSVIDSVEHRRDCLKRVLAINPGNKVAQRGLAGLEQKQVRQPTSPGRPALATLPDQAASAVLHKPPPTVLPRVKQTESDAELVDRLSAQLDALIELGEQAHKD